LCHVCNQNFLKSGFFYGGLLYSTSLSVHALKLKLNFKKEIRTMKTKILAMLAISTMALTACQQGVGLNSSSTGGMGNKQMIGGATGAILGGVLGSKVGKGTGQLVGVGAGALLGTLLGSELGASLDKADLAYAHQAENRAYTAPVGQAISWNNPDTGNSGTITPTREGVSNTTGRTCREYTQTIYVAGKQQTAVGQACKNADGTWTVMN